MTPIVCTEVWFRFNKSGLQGVRISSNEITAGRYLVVTQEGNWIQVKYLNVGLQLLKIVAYNANDVTDFSAEGITSLPAKPGNGRPEPLPVSGNGQQ